MLKKIIKLSAYIAGLIIFIVLALFFYFNLPVKTPEYDFKYGVTFSNLYSEEIGLDWKENYLAILDDLGVKKIRLPVYWNRIEKEESAYDFSEIDWQVSEAAKRNAEIILVIGRKVPRWPECFEPEWIKNKEVGIKNQALLNYLDKIVGRYKNNPAVKYWQVENEPFLPFGICPAFDSKLLDKEIELVRKADPGRKIIVTDSGELSIWIPAARRADVFGTTMYFNVYTKMFGYFKYPIGPNFFKFKKWLIGKFAGQENIMVVELQGEPWLNDWTTNVPLEKQLNSFNAGNLEKNLEFAKKTGIPEIYLWGAEWWWWLKEKNSHPDLWNKAKEIY